MLQRNDSILKRFVRKVAHELNGPWLYLSERGHILTIQVVDEGIPKLAECMKTLGIIRPNEAIVEQKFDVLVETPGSQRAILGCAIMFQVAYNVGDPFNVKGDEEDVPSEVHPMLRHDSIIILELLFLISAHPLLQWFGV